MALWQCGGVWRKKKARWRKQRQHQLKTALATTQHLGLISESIESDISK